MSIDANLFNLIIPYFELVLTMNNNLKQNFEILGN